MSNYNGIQVDRFDRAVRKTLAIKNAGVIPVLSPELQGGLDLGYQDNELSLSLGYVPFAAGRAQAAVAGQYGKVQLRNLSADKMAIVTMVSVACQTTAPLYIEIQGPPTTAGGLANSNVVFARDTRSWQGGASVTPAALDLLIEWGSTVVAPPIYGATYYTVITQNTSNLFPGPWMIGPGGAMICELGTVNDSIYVSYFGMLRQLDPGELTP